MRCLVLFIVLFFSVLWPAVVNATVNVTGNLKNALGQNLGSNTYVVFRLRNYGSNVPKVIGTGVIVQPEKRVDPDANGLITTTVFGNDEISPSGTYWVLEFFYQGRLSHAASYTISGASFNFNSATPITTTPTAPVGPDYVIKNPTGDQTVVQPTSTALKVNRLQADVIYQAVTYSATPTFDAAAASIFAMTLTGNVTSSTVSSATTGRIIELVLCQDGVGGRAFAWPATFLRPPTVASGASACTNTSFFYDGTNWRQLAAPGDSFLTGPANGGTGANNTATAGRYLRGDGTNFLTSAVAASGAGSCTNQFVRATNDNAVPTCASVSLTLDISGILAGANGGTGIAFAQFSGPTILRTYTIPDANATLEYQANKDAASGYAGLTAGVKLNLVQMQEVMAFGDLTGFSGVSGSGVTGIAATIAAPVANQVLTWNGSNWVNQAVAGTGSYTFSAGNKRWELFDSTIPTWLIDAKPGWVLDAQFGNAADDAVAVTLQSGNASFSYVVSIIVPGSGRTRITTTAGAGNVARVNGYLTQTNITYGDLQSFMVVVDPVQSNANTTQRMGFTGDTADPPTQGIYLERLGADTNWFLVTCTTPCSGGTQTRTNTGIAHAVGKVAFVVVRNGTTDVKVYTPGNATAIATSTTTLPADATACGPFLAVKTLNAATKDFDLYRLLAVGKQTGY